MILHEEMRNVVIQVHIFGNGVHSNQVMPTSHRESVIHGGRLSDGVLDRRLDL